MEIERVTRKRRTSRTLAKGPMQMYSWGALTVTVAVVGDDANHEIHVTMNEAEIRAALAKIEERKDEIKRLNNARFNNALEGN